MIGVALAVVLLSLEGLYYLTGVVKTWQSCTARGGAECVPLKILGYAVVVLVSIGILSYRQPMFMRFVGAMFFGLFLAGFCGIIGPMVSSYPWWVYASTFVVGTTGASILLPDDKLDEILYGTTQKVTIFEEVLEY